MSCFTAERQRGEGAKRGSPAGVQTVAPPGARSRGCCGRASRWRWPAQRPHWLGCKSAQQ